MGYKNEALKQRERHINKIFVSIIICSQSVCVLCWALSYASNHIAQITDNQPVRQLVGQPNHQVHFIQKFQELGTKSKRKQDGMKNGKKPRFQIYSKT